MGYSLNVLRLSVAIEYVEAIVKI